MCFCRRPAHWINHPDKGVETVCMALFVLLFSLITFVGSVIAIPWVVGRLDCNYFRAFALRVERGETKDRNGPFFVWALARNTLGLVLVALGLAMLVLPGQGIITLILGLSLLDFPGKRLFFARILKRRAVQQTLNWIRRKQGREEFVFSNSTKTGEHCYETRKNY